MRTHLWTPCIVAGVAFCSPLAAQTSADSASVTAFYREWFGAAAQSPEAYAGFYAADGMVLPPGMPPARGRDAIANWLRIAQTAATYTTRPEGIDVDEIRFLDSSWVLHRSTLRGQRVPRTGGDPIPFETKYVDLLHRSDSGRWEVAYRIWSDNR